MKNYNNESENTTRNNRSNYKPKDTDWLSTYLTRGDLSLFGSLSKLSIMIHLLLCFLPGVRSNGHLSSKRKLRDLFINKFGLSPNYKVFRLALKSLEDAGFIKIIKVNFWYSKFYVIDRVPQVIEPQIEQSEIEPQIEQSEIEPQIEQSQVKRGASTVDAECVIGGRVSSTTLNVNLKSATTANVIDKNVLSSPPESVGSVAADILNSLQEEPISPPIQSSVEPSKDSPSSIAVPAVVVAPTQQQEPIQAIVKPLSSGSPNEEELELIARVRAKFNKRIGFQKILSMIRETGFENVKNQFKWFPYRDIGGFRKGEEVAFCTFCRDEVGEPGVLRAQRRAEEERCKENRKEEEQRKEKQRKETEKKQAEADDSSRFDQILAKLSNDEIRKIKDKIVKALGQFFRDEDQKSFKDMFQREVLSCYA
jgi:hypothetical protein